MMTNPQPWTGREECSPSMSVPPKWRLSWEGLLVSQRKRIKDRFLRRDPAIFLFGVPLKHAQNRFPPQKLADFPAGNERMNAMNNPPGGFPFWNGCGSKLNRRGYAGFGPCFHLPGFHVGTGFLSHCRIP